MKTSDRVRQKDASAKEIPAMEPQATQSDGSDAFVVRYDSPLGYLIETFAPSLLLFGTPFCFLHNDAWRARNLPEQLNDSRIAWIFGVPLALVMVDFLLTLPRTLKGAPALVVTRDGVRGAHAWREKFIPWAELGDVYQRFGGLTIDRRATGTLTKAMYKLTVNSGRRQLYENSVFVLLRHADRSVEDILNAMARLRPDGDIARPISIGMTSNAAPGEKVFRPLIMAWLAIVVVGFVIATLNAR
jgi:hypothetical protein